jgi:hypothetical protein
VSIRGVALSIVIPTMENNFIAISVDDLLLDDYFD